MLKLPMVYPFKCDLKVARLGTHLILPGGVIRIEGGM